MSEFNCFDAYRRFAERLRHQSRYIRTPEDEEFLQAVLRTSKNRVTELQKGRVLWRAQLGHGLTPLCTGGQHAGDRPCALPYERMKPLERRATEGRANPKGIPVLYLSTCRETAMSEVRPWVDSLVSCARFEIMRTVKIVEFTVLSKRTRIFLKPPDSTEWDEENWRQIDLAFSEPTTVADDTADYAPTQVIAELFKSNGFDGIAYKSVFGTSGCNVALFDPAIAQPTRCFLFEVESLDFNFKPY